MNGIGQDLRTALRSLRRAPGFSLLAIAILALGIGVNTTIFTLVERVIFQSLPYPHANRLINIWERDTFAPPQYPNLPVNTGNFQYWKKHCPGFEHMAAIGPTGLTLTGHGQPMLLRTARVTSQLLPMLGVRPYLGTFFTPAENTRGQDHEVVLRYGLWQRLFHGNPNAVGKTLILDATVYRVAGVLPRNFYLPGSRWLYPITIPGNGPRFQMLKPYGYRPYEMKAGEGDFNDVVLAEMRPGVTLAQARAQLDTAESQISQSQHTYGKLSVKIMPLQSAVGRLARRGLWLLMAGAGMLLLLVCVNLANLLLARNSARMPEFAIRGAIGASRGRLLRQLTLEALLLALAGGALGTFLSAILLPLLVAQARWSMPRLEHLAWSGPVWVFALLTTILAGVLSGLWPALRLSKLSPARWIQSGGRTASEGKQSLRAREWLTTSEIALSTMLLIGALLLSVSLMKVLQANRIFLTQRVVSLAIPEPNPASLRQVRQFFRNVLTKVSALPGVSSAGLTSHLPLHGQSDIDGLRIQGQPYDPHHIIPLNVREVSGHYFQSLGIHLIQGAAFTPNQKNVVIISDNIERQCFHGHDPVGQQISKSIDKPQWARIVGVAADVRADAARPAPLTAYYPYFTSGYRGGMRLLVRASGSPQALDASLRQAIWSLNPEVPLRPPRTLAHLVLQATRPRSFEAMLTGSFALGAALLAGLGLYGVIATGVSLRRREIAIRMALGATPQNIRRLVLGRLGMLTACGLAVGLIGAWLLTRLLSSLLYGVSASNPWIYLGAAAGFAAIAIVAGLLPAHGASRTDPGQALHAE